MLKGKGREHTKRCLPRMVAKAHGSIEVLTVDLQDQRHPNNEGYEGG